MAAAARSPPAWPRRCRWWPTRRRRRARRFPSSSCSGSATGAELQLRSRDLEGADGVGQPIDALLDLLHGHARVGQAQRVLAALEQEVTALDERDLALGRGTEHGADIGAVGQL